MNDHIVNKIEWMCSGDPLWDSNVTWNTAYPDLTPCFQKTILRWIPCILLLVLSPLRLWILSSKESSRQSQPVCHSALSLAKYVLCLGLALLAFLECIETVFVNSLTEAMLKPEFISPALTGITMIVANHVMLTERRHRMQSSGLLFVYWFLMTVCLILNLQSQIRGLYVQEEMSLHFSACLLPLQLLLSIAELFLTGFFIDNFPEDDGSKSKKSCLENSPIMSALAFSWFTRIVKDAYKRPLEAKDLIELSTDLKSESTVPVFEKAWRDDSNRQKRRTDVNQNICSGNIKACLSRVILKIHFYEIFIHFLITVPIYLYSFIGPLIFRSLINFAEDADDYLWHGIFLASAYFLFGVVQTFQDTHSDHVGHMLGIKIRTSVCGAIYRKMAKLSNKAKQECTVGEMVNLMSDDATKINHRSIFELHLLWLGPVQACIAMYFLYQELGSAALVAFFLLVVFVPLIGVIAKAQHKINKEGKDITDKRMKVLNEVFNGMKVLKLYAWESSFGDKIGSIRSQEIHEKTKNRYLDIVNMFCWQMSEFLFTFSIFAVYLWLDEGNVLTTKKIYFIMSMISAFRGPLMYMPIAITSLIELSVSLKRIETFLNREEIDESAIQHSEDAEKAITMKAASFTWNKAKSPSLKNIDVDVANGELVAVIGSVGAGKSSLMSAAIGEMEKISGTVDVKGSVAFVTQEAWIQNNTLRENILFGRKMNVKNYRKAVEACALQADLDILPKGDETEIGEKGINLSGGQKQRVSLARAVYDDADIYLLDDPLSAVDARVGRHLFDQVIGNRGLLRNKTRVLVTHAISFLPYVDRVISLVNGEVSEVGTYTELMERNGAFAEFVRTHLQEESSSDDESTDGSTRPASFDRQVSTIDHLNTKEVTENEERCKDSKFIEEESINLDEAKWSAYGTYLKIVGPVLLVMFAACLAQNAADFYKNYWLSEWDSDISDNKTELNSSAQAISQGYKIKGFGLIGLINTLLNVLGELSVIFIVVTSAKKVHQKTLAGVMRAPFSFFENTPVGRMVNRFSKDMECLEHSLPWVTKSFMHTFPRIVFTLIVITSGMPTMVYFLVPLFIMYFLIQRLFSVAACQCRRMNKALRSPQFSFFSESIQGATTIRAFNKTSLFAQECDRRRDAFHKAELTTLSCYRWLNFRLGFLGNLLVFIACVLACYRRDVLSSGMIALIMTYAGNVTDTLRWIVFAFTEMDTNIITVERIQEYINLKPEADWRIKETEPASNWPQRGHVKFSNFSLRYREDLDLVLKGIDCDITPGEKIGIVGRTGAGKSSLTLALFRILEKAGGSIIIDDVDISTIGLHDLRSKLTIIPQDPVLFSGTLRMNLDPFNSFSDDDLWEALEHAHLKKYVESLEGGLLYECSERGENLSVGQRQLICLARALLKKSKILVLDEATAAVDLKTDNLIQNTIRREFSECTILTIAHRLNTVLDYSRIMVLDKGQIKEFDSPDVLLKDENSIFHSMAKAANLV
uniref:ABC-type glutathione-S-conjugate transporter n=1 Tax=Magallana gigas TaxID=29159 RepID=A0A8W8K4Y8_MAGGI|nr:multidrug resistance-associated protein 1 [Crassostrea gigas]